MEIDGDTEKLVMHAARSTYGAFVGAQGAFFLVNVFAWVRSDPIILVVLLLLLCLSLVWIAAFEVRVEEGSFRYRSLFVRRRFNLKDIVNTKVEVGYTKEYSNPFGPPIRLAITYNDGSRKSVARLNLKVFSRRDLESLFALLKVSDRKPWRRRRERVPAIPAQDHDSWKDIEGQDLGKE